MADESVAMVMWDHMDTTTTGLSLFAFVLVFIILWIGG